MTTSNNKNSVTIWKKMVNAGENMKETEEKEIEIEEIEEIDVDSETKAFNDKKVLDYLDNSFTENEILEEGEGDNIYEDNMDDSRQFIDDIGDDRDVAYSSVSNDNSAYSNAVESREMDERDNSYDREEKSLDVSSLVKDKVSRSRKTSSSNEVSKPIEKFQRLFDDAVQVFAHQAQASVAEDTDIFELERRHAKAVNLRKSVSNIIDLNHELEILSAMHLSFKRTKEMQLMHTLFDQCNNQALSNEKTIVIIQKEIDKLMREGGSIEDGEYLDKMMILQNSLDSGIARTKTIIDSTNALIRLERMSGSRPFGDRKGEGGTNINYLKGISGMDGEGMYNKIGAEDEIKVRKAKTIDALELTERINKSKKY